VKALPKKRIPLVVKPGADHERLQALTGDWKAETSSWHRPGGPVKLARGTLSSFWILGGRYIGQVYQSRTQRPKYQGIGAISYDKNRNMYTSVWLDTKSTSIYSASGMYSESINALILKGTYHDPERGTPERRKSVTRIINEKKYTFELFREGADGKMFKALEIIYTR